MKRNFSIILILISLISSCQSEKKVSARKLLSENHMDFPEYKQLNYAGIQFNCPTLFEHSFDRSFIVKNKGLVKENTELYLNFSIEAFSKKEVLQFQKEFSGKIDLLNALHDYYIQKRKKSITNYWISIKKSTPHSKNFKGVFQSIDGDLHNNGYFTTYFTTTIECKKKFYVIQLIGQRENMGYLYDDFNKIITSIK